MNTQQAIEDALKITSQLSEELHSVAMTAKRMAESEPDPGGRIIHMRVADDAEAKCAAIGTLAALGVQYLLDHPRSERSAE